MLDGFRYSSRLPFIDVSLQMRTQSRVLRFYIETIKSPYLDFVSRARPYDMIPLGRLLPRPLSRPSRGRLGREINTCEMIQPYPHDMSFNGQKSQ